MWCQTCLGLVFHAWIRCFARRVIWLFSWVSLAWFPVWVLHEIFALLFVSFTPELPRWLSALHIKSPLVHIGIFISVILAKLTQIKRGLDVLYKSSRLPVIALVTRWIINSAECLLLRRQKHLRILVRWVFKVWTHFSSALKGLRSVLIEVHTKRYDLIKKFQLLLLLKKHQIWLVALQQLFWIWFRDHTRQRFLWFF